MNKNRTSKNILLIAFILLIALSFTACSGKQTAQPITDITWQWTQLVETQPASQSLVPDSENYTLLLNEDGTVNIKADCNMVGGSYTLDGSELTIGQGPSTMAYCGEQSLDVLFLQILSNVESYTVEDGHLILNLKDGSGTMTFNEG